MKTALLAEDTAIGQAIGKAMLQALGYQVTCVEDGPQAVLTGESQDFDCALLDLQLPGMNGLDVARHLRQAHAGRDRPAPHIVLVTACEPEWVAAEIAAGTIQAYLAKPLRPAYLKIALGLAD